MNQTCDTMDDNGTVAGLTAVSKKMSSSHQVVREIQNRISAGVLRPGSRLGSERALAKEFDCSRATIQKALMELERAGMLFRRPNHRPVISPNLPNRSANETKQADQIAVWMLSDRQDDGGMMMLQGIRSVLGQENYRLLIGCPPSYEREVVETAEVGFLSALADNPRVAGAIVWDSGNLGCVPVYRSLVESKFPLVFIDREPPYQVEADLVACNNRRAARNAVRHLIDLGHRRISMVLGSDHASSVNDRVEGYRIALSEAEIAQNAGPIIELPGDEPESLLLEAERLLTDIASRTDGPTALFAVNDRIALILFQAAKHVGMAVPERLSIVGFDWLLRWTPSGGEITTVA
ncbi:MAG TPA: GntR family transcriptional regulator, partial [Fimbriimonas sp.]|nr:GntR family transcriptional regulator [Fimbriimonas sp.]